MPFFLKPGESDDFQFNFGSRMSGVTATGYQIFAPANIAVALSSSGLSAINMRLASASAPGVYLVSAFIDTSNNRRLWDVMEIHCG